MMHDDRWICGCILTGMPTAVVIAELGAICKCNGVNADEAGQEQKANRESKLHYSHRKKTYGFLRCGSVG
jgi:hypothetical protein